MGRTDVLARRRKYVKVLKKSFRCRKQQYQLKGINLLRDVIKEEKFSPEQLAKFLNDEDLFEALADALSTLGLEQGEYISKCFLMVASSETFFKLSQAGYIIQSSLRLFKISLKQTLNSPSASLNIQLILTILKRLLAQNVRLSHVCDSSQSSLILLCQATLKHKRKDTKIILNCCHVVIALLSEAISSNPSDINELIHTARAAAICINSVVNKQSVPEKRDCVYLFSRLSYLLLRASTLNTNLPIQEEELMKLIYSVMVKLSIPYLKVVAQECKDDDVIKAILVLIGEWLLQKREIKSAKGLHNIIVSSGLFSYLALLRKNAEAQKEINYILTEVVILFFEQDLCSSPPASSHESEKMRDIILSGYNTLPKNVQKWSDVLLESPTTKSFSVLFFYCVHYVCASRVSLQVFSAVCHFIRGIPKNPPKPMLKALWLLFALLYLNCERSKRSKVKNIFESQNVIIQLLTDIDDDLHQVFVHHKALLFWTFSSSAVPPSLQEKVVDLWLSKLNPKTLLDTKSCCQTSRTISICVLKVLFHTKNPVSAKRAKKIFKSLLVTKPSEYRNALWEMSLRVLNSESIEELNAFYIISLLIQFPLEDIDLSRKLSFIKCLITFSEGCQAASQDQKHFLLISRIARLLLNLLTSGAPVPPLIITDDKLLKLIETNLRSSDLDIYHQTAHLAIFILKSLPPDFQVDYKVKINLPLVLEYVFAESETLSTASISLINLILEHQTSKFCSFVTDQSFPLLRTLYLHLQLLLMKMMKNTLQSSEAIWNCMSLVLDKCAKLNSRKLISHLVTQSMTPAVINHFFSVTECTQDLFSKGFLMFLACWFQHINNDELIMHLLISQRRTASHFVMPLHKTIIESSEKFLQFIDELEINTLTSPLLPQLQYLASTRPLFESAEKMLESEKNLIL